MSDYYDHTGYPSTGSAGLSSSMRAEFDKIAAGFGKLPALAGNDGKALVVGGGGTSVGVSTGTLTLSGNFIKAASHALTLTTTATTSLTLPTSGTLATLAGTETFTNKTLSSPSFSGTSAAGTLNGIFTIQSTVTNNWAFGTAPSTAAGCVMVFTGTGPGSGQAKGLYVTGFATGLVSDSMVGTLLSTQINRAASGTHPNADGVLITGPSNTGSATVTTASTLRISNPPTFGVSNYSILVDAGITRLNGLLDLSGPQAGQVKFPSTAIPSSDTNTLDDYEEGSWTPGVGGNATYSLQVGRYTKIGNLVFIVGAMTITTLGTGSNSVISGVPFTSNSACDYPASIAYVANCASSFISIFGRVDASAATMTFFASAAASTTSSSITNIFGNGTTIQFSAVYRV